MGRYFARGGAARCAALAVAGLCAAFSLAGEGEGKVATNAFRLAYTADDLDLGACRQFINGQGANADPEEVKRALGLFPADGNWEEKVWAVGGGEAGAETVYEMLVVFKHPVAIGTIAVSPANIGDNQGSANGGELFYLKPQALAADPRQAEAWQQVAFGSIAQHLRFAVLPPGVKSQALLYRDKRVAGTARLLYLHAYRQRLQDLTPAAVGACEPAEGAQDVDGIPLGKGWAIEPKGGVNAKQPVRYTLIWEQKRIFAGLFLYSNAAEVKIYAHRGKAADPQASSAADWQEVKAVPDFVNRHVFPHWEYSYRWFTLPNVETNALRLEIGEVVKGGNTLWVSGLACFSALGETAAAEVKPKGLGPPFRFTVNMPASGDAALVIEDAAGRRVRNLFAQTFRQVGEHQEPWDLRDERGEFIAAGEYRWKAIVGPQLALVYHLTPYPNIQNYWPDRMPWLIGHAGEHGWLSDHSCNWACTTSGDKLFFAASMAEAGVTLIECDLDGKKKWGRHDFGAWKGVYQMAADEESLYVDNGDDVFRIELAARREANKFTPRQGPHRRGWRSAMTARDGRVYLAYTGEPTFDNAATADALDMAHCFPKADHGDLARILRISGAPPGDKVDPRSLQPQGNGRLYLESAPLREIAEKSQRKDKAGKKNEVVLAGTGDLEGDEFALDEKGKETAVIVLAFKQPVPLGSAVFPYPPGEGVLQFSVLKPDAPYPPRAAEDKDWQPFAASPAPGWNCLPAPPRVMTRGLRILLQPKSKDTPFWRLDGLRLLNRRFADVRPKARIRVSSGKVGVNGEWDAERDEPVSPDKPGIYLIEWKEPQTLCGLAFKEIEGDVAEIDVWQGAATGAVPLEGMACDRKSKAPGWRNTATYKQKRRSAEYSRCNKFARYLDGYVDFNENITTRAVRIRIIAPWLDNGPEGDLCNRHDGRSEHGLHYRESYCLKIDPKVCRIHGVAALAALGDDPPRDPMTYERIEIWDGKSGALVKELPVRPGWHGLCFDPSGSLHVIEKNHEVISRVDLENGKLTPVLKDTQPSNFVIGPDDLFYIRPWDDKAPIAVYTAGGQKVREIGKTGGLQPGHWDPARLGQVHRMCVDKNKNLWVVESQDNPRRIVQFKTDGTFVKEILGNTHYGGGGTMDRTNIRRAFHGRVEFEIDLDKHTSRIRALLNDDVGEPVMRKVKGRLYLTTAPLTLHDRQAVGKVYLYDEKASAVRLAAAMGDAGGFAPLRRGAILNLLKGDLPKNFGFLWCDRNENAAVDAEEVEFIPKKNVWHSMGVGMFDENLGCCGNEYYFAVGDITAGGMPLYQKIPAPGHPHYRLADGSFLYLHTAPMEKERSENFVRAPNGQKRWGYSASGGVSGLSIPGWEPGLATNQFGIIGHEYAKRGDLGEFFVIHDNTGQWRIWTADGLLAGNIFYHKMEPRGRLLGPGDVKFGQRLDPLSTSQEHFHGFFTGSDEEGRFFAVAGFTHMSIFEVKGLENFRRASGVLRVNAGDIEKAKAWESARQRRQSGGGRAAVLLARFVEEDEAPALDGRAGGNEWPAAATLAAMSGVSCAMAYDTRNLYVCWQAKAMGPLRNDGSDWRRLFKTGACLDLQLGADENAPPARANPVAGDLRLLIAVVDKKPKAVLYQPVAPNAKGNEAWSTRTAAAGEVKFSRVVAVEEEIEIAMTNDKDVVVEIAIPLRLLGLVPVKGMRIKGDWGILVSDDGHQVKARHYWANTAATGTADEAVEARLEPAKWGIIAFE